jgi:peptidoglycan/LPS O-acetylase OafA/YrhL
MRTQKISDILHANKGIGPGFESLRLILSLVILCWHAFGVCYGFVLVMPVLQPIKMALLVMFFVLSGFLITGSALRLQSFKTFMAFRLLRIFPALIVEVVLSAVILGAVLTTLPLEVYFSHPQFFLYFANIFGFFQMYLPGVFTDHPLRIVNMNLWTLKAEYLCYIIIGFFFLFGLFSRRKFFLLLFAILTFYLFFQFPGSMLVHRTFNFGSGALMFSCMLGVLFYLYKDHIPVSRIYFCVSAVLAYVCFSFPSTYGLGLLPMAYCTVYMGVVRFPKLNFFNGGDYSYGIYLYGYPITQVIWHYFPMAQSWPMILILVVPVTMAFSIVSWHCIEKHALKLKPYFLKK